MPGPLHASPCMAGTPALLRVIDAAVRSVFFIWLLRKGFQSREEKRTQDRKAGSGQSASVASIYELSRHPL